MAKEKITIELKNKSGIIKTTPDILKLIREKFSVPNPSYKMRRFQARKYVITPSGAFEIGLWHEIHSYILSLNIPIKLEIAKDFDKAFQPGYSDIPMAKIDGFDYYDYQEGTIKEFLSVGRGIGLLATGAGKSLIIGGFCKSLIEKNPNAKILVIVPNTYLLNQLHTSFHGEFNYPVSTRWGDGNKPDLSKNVVIANTQILLVNIEASLKIVKDYDAVIVDEVHTLGERTNKINKIVHNMTTFHKFGLTGTLPDNLLAAWNVVGKIGPILIEETSYKLMEKKTITPVKIKIIYCKHTHIPIFPVVTGEPTEMYNAELEYLQNCAARNNLIKNLCHKLDGNVLVIVERLEQGQILLDLLKTEGKEVYFIHGDMPTEERFVITEKMEVQDNIVAVAMSRIFSTGISVKNIPFIVFVSIGKANIKIAQSIGRTVRLHKNKEFSTAFDFADNLKYSKKHLTNNRIKQYKEAKFPYEIKQITL